MRHDVPASASPFPDLSRPGQIEIPGSVQLTVPTPTLWRGSTVLPAGAHRLEILVTEEKNVVLTTAALGRRHRLPVSRADYESPVDGVRVGLSAVEGPGGVHGWLLIQWGALLLQGEFHRLPESTQKLLHWRFTSYDFPSELHISGELPLGVLERTEGDRTRRHLTLISGTPARLRVEDSRLLEMRTEKESLLREQKVLRRRIRRAATEDTALNTRAQAIEGRLRILTEGIRSFELDPASYVVEAEPLGVVESPDGNATLHQDGNRLSITTGGILGAQRFGLKESAE